MKTPRQNNNGCNGSLKTFWSLDLLEDDVKQRWQGQDDPEHHEASHYTSWAQFKAILFTIMLNITEFTPDGLMDQLPNVVVPAKCASRNDLWVAIEQVQAAAKTLAEMKAIDATAQKCHKLKHPR